MKFSVFVILSALFCHVISEYIPGTAAAATYSTDSGEINGSSNEHDTTVEVRDMHDVLSDEPLLSGCKGETITTLFINEALRRETRISDGTLARKVSIKEDFSSLFIYYDASGVLETKREKYYPDRTLSEFTSFGYHDNGNLMKRYSYKFNINGGITEASYISFDEDGNIELKVTINVIYVPNGIWKLKISRYVFYEGKLVPDGSRNNSFTAEQMGIQRDIVAATFAYEESK